MVEFYYNNNKSNDSSNKGNNFDYWIELGVRVNYCIIFIILMKKILKMKKLIDKWRWEKIIVGLKVIMILIFSCCFFIVKIM